MSVIVITNLTGIIQTVSDLGFNFQPNQTRTISDFFDEADILNSADLKSKIIGSILYATIDDLVITTTNTSTMLSTPKTFDIPTSKYWWTGDFRTATSADYLNTSANIYKLWTSFEYFGTNVWTPKVFNAISYTDSNSYNTMIYIRLYDIINNNIIAQLSYSNSQDTDNSNLISTNTFYNLPANNTILEIQLMATRSSVHIYLPNVNLR